jgi:uncharacterized protein
LKRSTAFWDASALIPVSIQEPTTRQVRLNLRKFAPVVWWASVVEIHGAISRLHRNGAINAVEKEGALARLGILSRGWREILPDDSLRELAETLLDTYPLRSADCLQLAAALTWCQRHPAHRTFLCSDKSLGKAAKRAGFSVIQLS